MLTVKLIYHQFIEIIGNFYNTNNNLIITENIFYSMSIRKHLTQYLCKLNQLEILAEKIRQSLAQNAYFQTQSVFQRFDALKRGHLTPSDFSQFMLDNKVYPTQQELFLIFRQFDNHQNGIVTVERLSDQLLPRYNDKLRNQALKRKPYPVDIRLSMDLQFLLAKYFENKIIAIKELNKIREQIHKSKLFSIEEAFTLIDYNNNGYISKIAEVDRFLRQNGQALADSDLKRIYRSLNFNKEGFITYETLLQHLDPVSSIYYTTYKQRMAERNIQILKFSKEKAIIEENMLRNSIRSAQLAQNIEDLKYSNRKLQDMISRQDIELSRMANSHYIVPKYYPPYF